MPAPRHQHAPATGPTTDPTTGPTTGPLDDGPADPLGVLTGATGPAGPLTWFRPVVDCAAAVVVAWHAQDRPGGGTSDDLAVQADLLRRRLRAAEQLPPDTFLLVDTPAELLRRPAGHRCLAGAGSLARVVLRLAGDLEPGDDALRDGIDLVRRLGGRVAVTDGGSGQSGLRLMTRLRPELVVVDPSLVVGCATDAVSLASVEVLGVWASSLDAWVLATGVDSVDDYAALARLGVPLVEGDLLGRSRPGLREPDPSGLAMLRAQRDRVALRETVVSLVASWPVLPWTGEPTAPDGPDGPAPLRTACVLHDAGRPVGLVHESAAGWVSVPVSLRVRASERPATALRRAMGRDTARRWDPVVVTDGSGWVIGVVTVEALVQRALEDAAGT